MQLVLSLPSHKTVAADWDCAALLFRSTEGGHVFAAGDTFSLGMPVRPQISSAWAARYETVMSYQFAFLSTNIKSEKILTNVVNHFQTDRVQGLRRILRGRLPPLALEAITRGRK